MIQRFFTYLLSAFVALTLLAGCAKSDEGVDVDYGYVQFKLVKASQAEDSSTRAEELEWLSEAHKITVVMQCDGSTITQTLPLSSYDTESAEWGLYSEKLRLLTGQYNVIGYYLYDNLDQQLLTGEGAGTFVVTNRGLVSKQIGVECVERGKISFALFKAIETRYEAKGDYPFESVRSIDVTVRNKFTNEVTTFTSMTTSYYEAFVEGSMDKELYDYNGKSAYMVCSGEYWIKAGNYEITSYTTYSDAKGKNRLETATIADLDEFDFTVKDNQRGEFVIVPIILSRTAEYIKDYEALKAIWLALDGPNWTFHGEEYNARTNWNFNKDIDMWGDQPGVTLDGDGRVVGLNISGFGARGVVPEEIGQLTKLKTLYLGNHNELIGGYEDLSARIGAMDYHDRYLKRDTREGLTPELRDIINRGGELRPIVQSKPQKRDVAFGNLTNGITGISRAMMRLTELEQFYIANSPITSDTFITELAPNSKYKSEEESWSWGDFTMLMDFEIYNCSKLDKLPCEMLAGLPALQSVNLSMNQGISAEQLKADWEAIIDGASGDDIQILYLSGNNLRETPSHDYLKRMTKLGLLDLNSNNLEVVHPFGKEINLTTIYLDFNNIKEIKAAEDGYFCGMSQLETFSCSNNALTELPDIFTARSVYTMLSADFSSNKISKLAGGEAWQGINTSTLNLANNRFEELPARIMKSGSRIETLMLSSNGIRKIEEGALTGPYSYYITTLDLSYNRLSEIPYNDFSATNLPYLYGIDLSNNALSEFPYAPLSINSLTVISVRCQRDDEGNRTLSEWPTGIASCPKLSAFYIGSNDLRKIEDTISPYIMIFEIKDNPNISIDLSEVCPYIEMDYYLLIYDSTQDIRGCDALDLD